MPGEKPRNPQKDPRIPELERLAKEADAGRFDNLECPECRQLGVAVWFTHRADDVYRMWFICAHCTFHTRVQLAGRPHNLSKSRINAELEKRDLAILTQSKFKRPPRG